MEVEPPATCDLYLELEASRSACRFSSAQFNVDRADGRRLTWLAAICFNYLEHQVVLHLDFDL
jgi:hypothetical protein